MVIYKYVFGCKINIKPGDICAIRHAVLFQHGKDFGFAYLHIAGYTDIPQKLGGGEQQCRRDDKSRHDSVSVPVTGYQKRNARSVGYLCADTVFIGEPDYLFAGKQACTDCHFTAARQRRIKEQIFFQAGIYEFRRAGAGQGYFV